MPRYPDPISMGKSMLGPQTRRDFLKRLVGAAASAAMPKLPEAPAAVPAAPAVKFVEDPRIMSGFSGLSTFGKSKGHGHANFWIEGDFPETDGLDAGQVRSLIKRRFNLNPDEPDKLPWSLTEGVPHWSDDPEGRIGYHEYNAITRKWHPVVAIPNKERGISIRYLEPGSAIPENALSGNPDSIATSPWSDPEFLDGNHVFDSPGEMSNHLMDDWRHLRSYEFEKKGPNKDDLARDPELRRDYLRSAAERGIAHGTRFEPLAGLTASREVPLPIEQPRQPHMSKARKAAAAAPFLAVPLLAPREEKE